MEDHPGFPPPFPFEASLTLDQMISQENIWGNLQMPPSFPHPMSNNLPLRRQSLYYKTRMCVRFKHWRCPNGDNCNFAHGFEELRRPLSNEADRTWVPHEDFYVDCRQNPSIPNGHVLFNQSEEQKMHKNKGCGKFNNGGICPNGDDCSFVHVETGFLQNGRGDQNLSSCQKLVFWKTKLCHKWSTSGQCPYGDQCNHAHGDADLRKPGEDHCKVDDNSVAAAPSNLSPSLPPAPSRIRALTLEKSKRIYGDWIDD